MSSALTVFLLERSSRFARLQGIQCALAGKNVYMRFTCGTGDAMGMNMVSKGVQNVLDYLQDDFPDMEVVSISGNLCSDKKPTAVNWIEGRGKSVVCEAIIKEEVVMKVLKTSVAALVELNTLKNLAGSTVAGSLGVLTLMPAILCLQSSLLLAKILRKMWKAPLHYHPFLVDLIVYKLGMKLLVYKEALVPIQDYQ